MVAFLDNWSTVAFYRSISVAFLITMNTTNSTLDFFKNLTVVNPVNLPFENYRVVISALTLFLNLALLFLFLSEKSLRNTFTVYLVFLTLGNIAISLFFLPLDFFWMSVNESVPIGTVQCGATLILNGVVGGTVLNFHTLITVNRLWALMLPLSFRNFHSQRVALLSCVGVIVYQNILFLPGFISDLVYLPPEMNCKSGDHVLPGWQQAYTLLSETLPALTVVVGYFVIIAKLMQIRRANKRRTGTGQNTEQATPGNKGKSKAKQDNSFGVLTASTLSVAVAWIPYAIGYSMPTEPPAMTLIIRALIQLQSLLDPLLLLAFSRNIQQAVGSRLFCWRPRANTSATFVTQTSMTARPVP